MRCSPKYVNGALPLLREGVARRDHELDCENEIAKNMFCEWVYDLKKTHVIACSAGCKNSDNFCLCTPAHDSKGNCDSGCKVLTFSFILRVFTFTSNEP